MLVHPACHEELLAGEMEPLNDREALPAGRRHAVLGELTVSLVRDERAARLPAFAQIQDISARRHAAEMLDRRARTARPPLSSGGSRWSRPTSSELAERIAEAVAERLGADTCQITEVDGMELHNLAVARRRRRPQPRASAGRCGERSLAGLVFGTDRPLVVEDLGAGGSTPRRGALLRHAQRDGRRGRGPDGPAGMVAVFSCEHRTWSHEESSFLHVVANVMGSAIEPMTLATTCRNDDSSWLQVRCSQLNTATMPAGPSRPLDRDTIVLRMPEEGGPAESRARCSPGPPPPAAVGPEHQPGERDARASSSARQVAAADVGAIDARQCSSTPSTSVIGRCPRRAARRRPPRAARRAALGLQPRPARSGRAQRRPRCSGRGGASASAVRRCSEMSRIWDCRETGRPRSSRTRESRVTSPSTCRCSRPAVALPRDAPSRRRAAPRAGRAGRASAGLAEVRRRSRPRCRRPPSQELRQRRVDVEHRHGEVGERHRRRRVLESAAEALLRDAQRG